MSKCTRHATPCPTSCAARPENHAQHEVPAPRVRGNARAARGAAKPFPGPLCGICRAMVERRLGPVEVELAAKKEDCVHCKLHIDAVKRGRARGLAEVERQQQLRKTKGKP